MTNPSLPTPVSIRKYSQKGRRSGRRLAAAMAFVLNFPRLRAREIRLRVLQKEIAYGDRDSANFSRGMGSALRQESDKLMTTYTNVCREDQQVVDLMMDYDLSAEDLHNIYVRLKLAGLDHWINGRHAALSTIACAESLEFFIESERRRIAPVATAIVLIEYWEGRIRKGRLLDYLES